MNASITRLFAPPNAVIPAAMGVRVHQNRHTGLTRISLLAGLVLALLALANVMALSNWHASLLDHDDLAADAAPTGHGHHHHGDADEDHPPAELGTADQGSRTIDLHALTHAMIHGLAGLVPNFSVAILFHEAASDWFSGRSFSLSGISPEGLLRPPRF
ncbi:hypothetical protein [Novosphingobium resinovorum]|uniref:hypothetical protein n=1 Tax=Novosphingobium resinovorum TaxID=158500 RepID=UPI0018D3BDB0|nr:hypothetical protein [Novosphingobium resinovorum]